jgi:hypothetical protein
MAKVDSIAVTDGADDGMVQLEGGDFLMGSEDGWAYAVDAFEPQRVRPAQHDRQGVGMVPGPVRR